MKRMVVVGIMSAVLVFAPSAAQARSHHMPSMHHVVLHPSKSVKPKHKVTRQRRIK